MRKLQFTEGKELGLSYSAGRWSSWGFKAWIYRQESRESGEQHKHGSLNRLQVHQIF